MSSNSIFSESLRTYKLDGSNFTVWKRKITYLVTTENIDYVIDLPAPEKPEIDTSPEEKANYMQEYETRSRDNKRAHIFMLGSMTGSLAAEYEGEKNAQKIMSRLEKDFGDISLVKVFSLVNRFLSMKMSEDNSANEHINKLSVLAEELKIAGYPF
jgi:hypothetical protein